MENKQEQQKTKCPHCKSEEVVRRGTFETKAHGKQQVFFCKNCSKKFIVRTAFYRMRNNSYKITSALNLFYSGVSTRKVQQHFKMFYPHNSSWVSIYSWVVKYAKLIHKFTDSLKLSVGSEIQFDEVEYERRKSHKKGSKGTQTNYFIDSVDTTTRFMVASNYCKSRSTNEIKEVIQRAKNKTDNQIVICTTDGYNGYIKAVQKVFGYYAIKKGEVEHNQVTQLKGEGFNHPIERLHNSLRARTKIFRGFHGNIESANSILKGFEIFYNFINKHQAINCCPYELATDLKFTQDNKWLELIQLAEKQSI
jgi:transposase-like protein